MSEEDDKKTNRVQQLREDRLLSKAELARRLGTTRAVVTRNLSGSQNMTLRTFADMATVLGKEVRVTLVARKVVGQKTVGAEVA